MAKGAPRPDMTAYPISARRHSSACRKHQHCSVAGKWLPCSHQPVASPHLSPLEPPTPIRQTPRHPKAEPSKPNSPDSHLGSIQLGDLLGNLLLHLCQRSTKQPARFGCQKEACLPLNKIAAMGFHILRPYDEVGNKRRFLQILQKKNGTHAIHLQSFSFTD